MIARLFNAPLNNPDAEAVGVSTIGSSEAIILSVLAAKRRWQGLQTTILLKCIFLFNSSVEARKAAGKPCDKPNLVMNAAVQVCWEKAARYLEVEERYWYCTSEKFTIDPQEAVDLCDENTIMVCAILGSTYTGEYEDVKTLNDLLLKKNKAEGLNIHIHVDAASGGFVAPFVKPELVWDFRLPLVCGINVSGHKYGLVFSYFFIRNRRRIYSMIDSLAYAGVGWALWRSKEFLPTSILFTVNYLGSPQVRNLSPLRPQLRTDQ